MTGHLQDKKGGDPTSPTGRERPERNGGMHLIEVRVRENQILISGHANYAEPGKDIVCARVSTLAQSLIRFIESLKSDIIECEITPEWIDLRYKDLSDESKTLIDSFFIGITMIADEYPKYVRIM